MPTSHNRQLNEITEAIIQLNPRAVLDIGVGFGKYGFMCREFLDIYCKQKYGRENWSIRLEGVEAFPQYLNPIHDYVYDRVHQGAARDILPTLGGKFDLVLMIDVLEHMTYDDGTAMLKQCLALSRNVLVSTPWYIGDQGATCGNEFETHRFQWRADHLRKQFDELGFIPNPYSLIALLGPGAKEAASRVRAMQWKSASYLAFPWVWRMYKRMRGLW